MNCKGFNWRVVVVFFVTALIEYSSFASCWAIERKGEKKAGPPERERASNHGAHRFTDKEKDI